MTHPMTPEQQIEEMAEEIWSLTERGENLRSRLVEGSKLGDEVALRVLDEMARRTMIETRGESIVLLAAGKDLGRTVVRRHRLAEVLLGQVLAVGEEAAEATACQVEHILSREVTDRICTYLGHPPTCPHGKEIPRGDCCVTFPKDLQPLVQPLTDLPIGASGRIVFITPVLYQRLDRLVTLGILPGGVVRLRQKRPSVVLEAGETAVALDAEICREIFVLPLER